MSEALTFAPRPDGTGGTIAIPLRRGNGACAIIDAADVPLVSGYSWTLSGDGYAVSYKVHGRRQVSMHRVLLGLLNAPRDVYVDHANGRRLDNRRANLRVCENSRNQANRQVVKSRTGYKGATLHKGTGKYQAACKKLGKNYHGGLHATALDAGVAYWQLAQKLHGPFAWTTPEVRAEAERRAREAAAQDANSADVRVAA